MPPGSQPLRRALLALLLVAAVGAAAVFVTDQQGGAGGGANASFPSGENISEQYDRLGGVVGTLETTTTRGNTTNTTVRLVKARPGTGMRYVRLLDGTDRGPDVVVSNGTVTWQYDREANTVTLRNTTYTSTRNRGAYIERLFARLDRTAATPVDTRRPTATPGVAPVPQVPSGGGGIVRVGGNVTGDQFGVTYEGKARVAGREAYVLQVSTDTKNGSAAAGNVTQTLWIDTEWYFILGHHVEGTVGGEPFETNATFRNVTFNPGLTDADFRFDPPAEATVERTDTPAMERYDSVAALQADAEMTVPRPDLPPEFAFSVGRRLTLNRSRMLSIQYGNDTSTLTVTKFNRTLESMLAEGGNDTREGETVRVGDSEGTYRTLGLSKTVSWECDGRSYSVSASGLSRAFLLDVAASIECA